MVDESFDSFTKKISKFWEFEMRKAETTRLSIKDITLPLARIKRLMKVEENVKMVASEVPILFSLAAEKFIEEFTLRAWMHTEESKRKILQATDIAKAAKTTSMYDFLMYILPDEEAGLVRRSKNENNAIDTSEESEED